jgi:hypothetical protein
MEREAEEMNSFATIQSIQYDLAAAGKSVGRVQVHRYLKRFQIKPLGVWTRPRLYPPDSVSRILEKFGLGSPRIK